MGKLYAKWLKCQGLFSGRGKGGKKQIEKNAKYMQGYAKNRV